MSAQPDARPKAEEVRKEIEWAVTMFESALRELFKAEQVVLEKRRALARAIDLVRDPDAPEVMP